MNPYSHSRRRLAGGFTLVELLVVIAIIAVLAALSMMGVRQFRSAADKVKAIRNISQLHVANAGYAADYGGRYIPVYIFDENKASKQSWYNSTTFLSYLNGENAVVKSTGNENTVALNLLDPIVTRAKQKRYDTYDANFGYNHEGFNGIPNTGWGNPNTQQSWLVSQVVSPERSCAFITCTDWIAKYSGRSLWKDSPVEGKTGDGKIAYRHKGNKALIVYYDGHVGEMTMKEIEALDQNADPAQKGIKNIFWDADGK